MIIHKYEFTRGDHMRYSYLICQLIWQAFNIEYGRLNMILL